MMMRFDGTGLAALRLYRCSKCDHITILSESEYAQKSIVGTGDCNFFVADYDDGDVQRCRGELKLMFVIGDKGGVTRCFP